MTNSGSGCRQASRHQTNSYAHPSKPEALPGSPPPPSSEKESTAIASPSPLRPSPAGVPVSRRLVRRSGVVDAWFMRSTTGLADTTSGPLPSWARARLKEQEREGATGKGCLTGHKHNPNNNNKSQKESFHASRRVHRHAPLTGSVGGGIGAGFCGGRLALLARLAFLL